MSMRRRMGREGEMVGEEEEKSSLVAVQEGKEDSERERERERRGGRGKNHTLVQLRSC
jgi:hypothetical protein